MINGVSKTIIENLSRCDKKRTGHENHWVDLKFLRMNDYFQGIIAILINITYLSFCTLTI